MEEKVSQRYYFSKKKVKRIFFIFLLIFVIANAWFYSIEYKRYVSQAPAHLKEARVDYVNSMMFHLYYTFLVKTIRIDFQNPILYPIKAPRDYFYHRGLDKLPLNEAERALWFNLFEVKPYNFSTKGVYGSMARHYGNDFAKEFVDNLYKNIEILSLYEISDKKTKDIYAESFGAYIDMISLYIFEFHLNKDGYLFRDENIKKVATDYELYKKFENIYNWHRKIAWKYKRENSKLFDDVVNISNGWYSSYRNYYRNSYVISSFILTYKINNNIFNCKEDEKYFKSKKWAQKGLDKMLKGYSQDSYQYRVTNQMYYYLYITRTNLKNQPKSIHPLQLKIDCKYYKKDK